MNVIGDPIDERGPINTKLRYPIHREAPAFDEQGSGAEILITGIKVVDLLAPYARGGKIGLFGGAGVGKLWSSRNSLTTSPRPMVDTQSLQESEKGQEKATISTTK